MIKNIFKNILVIFYLSLLTSVVLLLLGYYFEVLRESEYVFQIFIFYIILTFVMQFVFGFWIIYFILNKLKFGTLLVSIIGGLMSYLLMSFIAKMGFENYYFEPFKHPYQIWSFFVLGFLYPYFSRRFRNSENKIVNNKKSLNNLN